MEINNQRAASLKNSGFSLIELVAGIVVMAFALTFLSTLFFSDPGRSVRPLIQIRAVEFGQSLMDEILSKKFDQLTPEGGAPACATCSGTMGSDAGETGRSDYNDVDDYDDYCSPGSPVALEDAFGNLPAGFSGFTMSICVDYDGNYDATIDTNINAKLIVVEIYPPTSAGLDGPITLTAYRSNF